MTKYNSSFYRVDPLMKEIQGDLSNLNKLVNLVGFSVDSTPYTCKYGSNEQLLKPTKEFLIKMIDYVRGKKFSEKEYKKSRKDLYFGSAELRDSKTAEAKKLISAHYNDFGKLVKKYSWAVFEGETHPDIFIEGKDYIIIGEGKWTESHITTETANLKNKNGEFRSQMIRHIQAAINYSDKRVYSFYLVDENCNYLNDLTKEALINQLNSETIKLDNLKSKVIKSFYGYTTWQQIEAVFPSIKFLTKKEISAIGIK